MKNNVDMVSQKSKAGNQKYAKTGEKDDFLSLSITNKRKARPKGAQDWTFWLFFDKKVRSQTGGKVVPFIPKLPTMEDNA